MDSTGADNAESESYLGKMEFRLSAGETPILPAEPGIFLATFVSRQGRCKTSLQYSTNNLQDGWDRLLTIDEDVAQYYNECEYSTYFVWRVCNDEPARERLMTVLYNKWSQLFEQNKVSLILKARLHQSWADLSYVLSNLSVLPEALLDRFEQNESGRGTVIWDLTFVFVLSALMVLVVLNDLTPLVDWADSKEIFGAARGSLSEICDRIESTLVWLTLGYAIFRSLKEKPRAEDQ